MKGFSIGIDSISGCRLSSSVKRQPVAQQSHDALAQRPADQLGQAVVGLDRPDVGGDAVPEAVGGREVVDARFGDGLGDHPVDVEVDVAALGVVEDLPLDIGELQERSGRRNGTLGDLKCRCPSSVHSIAAQLAGAFADLTLVDSLHRQIEDGA